MKRMALPPVVNSRMSLLPSVMATPTSLSPGSSATAMMPLARGRENRASEVFFTVPRLVAMNTNLLSSNSLIGSMALMRSPSCSGNRFTIGLPRDPRLACGS